MDEFIYVLLGLTSVVGLAFIIERAWMLRWSKVVPPGIAEALAACETRDDVQTLRRVCEQKSVAAGTAAVDRLRASRLAESRQRGHAPDRRAP